MKRILLFLLSFPFLYSCAQEVVREKIPFTITPQRRLMSVPVSIHGVKGNLLFDTGGTGFLSLDTTYAENIEPFDSVEVQWEGLVGGGYSGFKTSSINNYKGLLNVYIGSHRFEKMYFSVGDFRKIFELSEFDGSFGIPRRDSTSVWQLNFEENYISIIPADSFYVDKSFLSFPLIWDKDGNVHIDLPLEICMSHGKVIKSNGRFLIDTGSIADVTYIGDIDEVKALNVDKDSAYWLYNRHFWDATIKVCDKVGLDFSRVYIYDLPVNMSHRRILGLNFFKRFNVYFDIKNEKLYLQPINKKFERITQGKKPWHQADNRISGKHVFIENIGDYKDNEAIKAGFKVDDEVLSINGIKNISCLSPEQEKKLLSDNIWNYVIKRKGKILHLKLNRHLENQIDD